MKAAVVAYVIVMAGFDLVWYRIPNLCIIAGAAVLAFLRIREEGGCAVFSAFPGMLLPFMLCLPLFALSMIGAGDVKLLMGLGIFAGPGGILRIMTYALFLAGAAAAGRIFWWKIGAFRAFYLMEYAKETGRSVQLLIQSRHRDGQVKDTQKKALISPYIQEEDIRERKPWLMHLSLPIAGGLILYILAG